MKEGKNLYYILKANKSLEPIARLAELAAIAHNLSLEAEKVGNELSVFACQAESVVDNVPPIEEWMVLCDYYKHCARDFSAALKKAVNRSHVRDIPMKIKEYTDGIIDKTIQAIENDDKLLDQLFRDSDDDEDD